jgi:hypothetical protein
MFLCSQILEFLNVSLVRCTFQPLKRTLYGTAICSSGECAKFIYCVALPHTFFLLKFTIITIQISISTSISSPRQQYLLLTSRSALDPSVIQQLFGWNFKYQQIWFALKIWTIAASYLDFPQGLEIFCFPKRQNHLWHTPILLLNGYRNSFPTGKAARKWHNTHPPTARVKDVWSCTFAPSFAFVACTWTLGMLKNVIYSKNIVYLSNQPDALIIQIYSFIKLYTFRASSLPIIRSFLLYIRHW